MHTDHAPPPPQESSGLTPFMLMMGREARLPAELMYGSPCNENWEIQSYGASADQLRNRMQHAHEVARKHLVFSARRQAEIYDSKLSVHHYNMGDYVWVEIEASKPGICPMWRSLYRGPCIITQKYNDLEFKVRRSKFGLQQVLHHNKLKPYEGDNEPKWAQKVKATLVTQDQH